MCIRDRGIIALGLASGLPTKEIVEIYEKYGPQIFPEAKTGLDGLIERMFHTRYDSTGLRESLQKFLEQKSMSDVSENIAVTSFDTSNSKPVIFRSVYGKDNGQFNDVKLVDIALATSAAPTYFPAAEAGNSYMIDGGIWANCPAMVGITESLKFFNQNLRDIRILSIGTTTEPQFINRDQQKGGLITWAKPIPSTIMHATKLSTISQSNDLAGFFHRIDTVVPPGRFSLDDTTAIGDLLALGRSEAEENFPECKKKFFTRLARFRPENTQVNKEPATA